MHNFAIVEFVDEGIFDLVSTAWLHGATQCYFPRPNATSNLERLLFDHVDPTSERGKEAGRWDLVDVRLISIKGMWLAVKSFHYFKQTFID